MLQEWRRQFHLERKQRDIQKFKTSLSWIIIIFMKLFAERFFA